MLQADFESASGKQASDRKHGQLQDRLPGSTDAVGSVLWPVDDWQIFGEQSLKFFHTDFAALARDQLRKGLLLTTDYSGMGAAEEALNQLLASSGIVEADGALPAGARFECLRAGDLLQQCRDVLSQHTGVFSPKCVHGDMMDRCPGNLKQRMQKLHDKAVATVESRASNPGAKMCRASVQDVGQSTVRKLAAFMLDIRKAPAAGLKAHCCIHNRQCPIVCPAPPAFAGLRVHIAGVNCTDWSKFGLRKNWLGPSTTVFMQWARERMLCKEDLIVVECVVPFDSDMLSELFQADYDLHVLLTTPALFGDPVERQRKYMLMFKKNRLAWRADVCACGVQAAFDRLFARTMLMMGSQKFRAPQDEIREYVPEQARRRHLPARSRSGQAWSFYQVASPAVRSAIDEHEQALSGRIAGGSPADLKRYMCNLNQKPAFQPARMDLVPTLLRSSKLWLFAERRWALSLELLEVQGYNVWGGYSSQASSAMQVVDARSRLADDLKCGFVTYLRTRSDLEIQRLAGNGMHLRVLGAVLLMCLGCTSYTPRF